MSVSAHAESSADDVKLGCAPADELKVCHFTIRTQRVRFLLLVLVSALLLVGAAANYVIYQVAPSPDHRLAKLAQRFDLGHEPSVCSWYSSLALLVSASLLVMIALAKRSAKDPSTGYWCGLAVLFVALSLDESVMVHEMLHNTLRERWDTTGVLYFPWVIPGVCFCVFVGVIYLKFLWNLEPRTRWQFLVAGAVFISGAIGMEMVAGVIIESEGVASIKHTISQTIEEGLEMLGVVLFISALLDYIARHLGTVSFGGEHTSLSVSSFGTNLVTSEQRAI